jgi:hypothetical protein
VFPVLVNGQIQTYVDVHLKYIFLLDFNQNWSVFTHMSKNLQYKITRKSVAWDGQTVTVHYFCLRTRLKLICGVNIRGFKDFFPSFALFFHS